MGGPKYSEGRNVNLRPDTKNIMSALEERVKMVKTIKVDTSVLNNWLELLKKKVKLAIHLLNVGALPEVKQVLRHPEFKDHFLTFI